MNKNYIYLFTISYILFTLVMIGVVLHATHNTEDPTLKPNFTTEHHTDQYVNKTVVEKRDIVYQNSYRYDKINFQTNQQPLEFQHTHHKLIADDIDHCMKFFGRSMQPAIWDGNTVCYKEIAGEEADQGDIIYYKREEQNVVHTVVGEYHKWGYVQTKGYSSLKGEKVDHSDVIGKVVAVLYTDR